MYNDTTSARVAPYVYSGGLRACASSSMEFDVDRWVSDTLAEHASTAMLVDASKHVDSADEYDSRLLDKLRVIVGADSAASDDLRENSNTNAETAMGAMLKAGSEAMKHYYLTEMIDPEIAKAHQSGLIHIHDLDFYGFTATCLQLNLGKLYEDGFFTGQGTVRTPQSIRSYWSLLCIAIQASQNDMHGGQSIPLLEYYLAPGVAKTFAKTLATAVLDANDLWETHGADAASRFRDQAMATVFKEHNSLMSDSALADLVAMCAQTFGVEPTEQQVRLSTMKTVDECLQGAEAAIHNLCTMASRAGAQVPFSSVNYGTGTLPEQRMVIGCILHALESGLGKGESPIFPIHVFKVKEGVNYAPGDPNYDLFKKALSVTGKRMFPNYLFLDAPFNLQYYVEGNPDTEVATMGCVSGDSIVYYSFDGTTHKEDIATMFEKYAAINEVPPKRTSGGTEYYRTSNIGLKIWDSHEGRFVRVLTILRNERTHNWKKIVFDNGCVLKATEDHPLPVIGKGRTFVCDLKIGDKLETSMVTADVGGISTATVRDIDFCDELNGEYSYDVETESDRFDVNGIVSHNCRTRVIGNVNGPSTTSGRGNLSFTTVNLPRLAIMAGSGNTDAFFEALENTVGLCIKQLLDRYEVQSNRKVKNYPMLFGNHMYMGSENLGDEDTVGTSLKHGTLSVGYVGLAEALVALTGKHHGECEEAQELGLRIIGRMRELLDTATAQYSLNFSLLATPAESTAGTLLRKDRQLFGVIPGVTDKDYYTNSNHVPVGFDIEARRKIELEAPYHALTNAGHITYIEFPGDPGANPEAMETIVRWMHDAGVGYGAINIPIDTCMDCGHTGSFTSCPECGNTDETRIHRLRRITGYLVGDMRTRFNDGKKAEVADRVRHTL